MISEVNIFTSHHDQRDLIRRTSTDLKETMNIAAQMMRLLAVCILTEMEQGDEKVDYCTVFL